MLPRFSILKVSWSVCNIPSFDTVAVDTIDSMVKDTSTSLVIELALIVIIEFIELMNNI